MKVSNTGEQNWKQSRIPDIRKSKGTDFAHLLKEETEGYHLDDKFADNKAFVDAEQKILYMTAIDESLIDQAHAIHFKDRLEHVETYEGLSKRFPHCSFPMQADPVKVDLSTLSDEKKAELNEKYQIDNIKPNSEEYHALIKDLQKEGILSGGNAYGLPPNVVDVSTDANGKITGVTVLFLGDDGENGNFLDYTRKTLGFSSKRYKELMGKDPLTSAEQAVIFIHESHQNIVTAIEAIFGRQLDLKE